MAEKIGFGEDRNKTIIRTPRLEVRVLRWDWTAAKERDRLDISKYILNMQWQKTIKTANAGAMIVCIPQVGRTHLLDYLSPMDVVQIFEFGSLKFQGFIRSIQSTGSIEESAGKPDRTVRINSLSFGNLFIDGQIGLNLFIRLQRGDIGAKMVAFAGTIADVVKDSSKTFADLVKTVVTEWFSYLEALGASEYAQYVNRFVDYETGVVGKRIPGFPRELRLFQIEQQQMSLWSVMQKVVEPPFNEIWFDNGPRSVFIENSNGLSGRPTEVDLPTSESNEKTYLVVRSTPFNGTVVDGTEKEQWDELPARTIPLGYLRKFTLNKSMDEAYSFYMVQPGGLNFSELQLIAVGAESLDEDAFDKYLYRPMVKTQFFSRFSAEDDTKADDESNSIVDVAQDASKTLKNWNQLNDVYLSGTFDIHVPSNADFDPRIGDKIQFEGLEGAYFYVEGVAHQWTYGGPLYATLTVTRGYGDAKPIELKDKIFRRGLFAMNEQYNEP